jgi:hypothetical protein
LRVRDATLDPPGRWRAGLIGGAWMGAAPLVALLAVGLGVALGWRGVDVAASVHRVIQFRHFGFTLWDSSWYGGQWTLDYSVIFAPVAATVGLHLLALLAAAVSALAFERLLTRQFGPAARPASIVFAVSTVVESAIGQLPFLSGEALALCALWAATRRSWPLAWALAAAATLLSPLAGAFAALGAVAGVIASRRSQTRRWCLAALGIPVAVGLPLLVTTVLFPGEGRMPFSFADCSWDLVIAGGILVITPRRERVLRTGILLYALALVGSFVVPSPLGNNIGRIENYVALPLAIVLLWPRSRLLLVGLAVPLVISGWAPAWGAVTSLPSQPSSSKAFYTPLDRWLERADPDGTRGRVEVVPTEAHWESVWVADVEPLARGWERQTDVTANPIFYQRGALTPASYRAWLLGNGVAFVALPAAPLDYAAKAEGRLVARGVPGLRPVWHNRDWRVWAVTGSTGLISGPGRVVTMGVQRVVVDADRAGPITVRVAWDDNWAVTDGNACATAAGRWTRLDVTRPGTVVMAVTVGSSKGRCPSP